PETVYVLNTGMYRSVDGGRSFTPLRAPHGDHHGLWIAPNDPARMINSNDGGANVSYNGGATWSGQDNQPTAQFYHVIATTHVPYKVCGSQQDNSTVCIASRTDGGSIGEKDRTRSAAARAARSRRAPTIPTSSTPAATATCRASTSGPARRATSSPGPTIRW